MELGPLEKRVVVDGLLERRAIDEVVLRTVLGRANRSRRPTLTQPQSVVRVDEPSSQSAFANAAGTDENRNEGFSGQELETVLRAASVRDP